MLSVLQIIEDTAVDGPGFRTAVYAAGCSHFCPGCHNPESWDIKKGKLCTVDEVLQVILSDPFADVTFSGGDPFYQAEEFAVLAQRIKQASHKTIWCYTGFLYEQLLQHPAQKKLLQTIDVLVDGPFIMKLRDESLLFRGSSNQRLIDVASSLKEGRVVLYEPF